MKSNQKQNLLQELELLLARVVPTGDVAYRVAEIAFVLTRLNGRFIEREHGFVNFLKHLECSPELRSDLMRDLVPLWGKISNLHEKYRKKECEATIRECARQDAPDNVNVPSSLVPLVRKLLSSKAGGLMLDIGCGHGLLLAQALEEDAELRGEGIDISHRNANFSEMVISPLKPRGDVYCKSVFDFMVDRIGKYDKVFCFPPIGIRMDRNWEDFQSMLPEGFPHVGTGCSSELVFALTTIAAMKETGRAVVILSEKALCGQKSGVVAVREYLLNSGYLECVIMLPEKMLEQLRIGVSLLVFSKQADRSHVTMIDASGLGKNKKGRRCDVLLVEDTEKIIKAVYCFRNDDEWMSRYSKIVSYDEIRGSVYNFSVQHYIKTATVCTKTDSRENRTPVSALCAISGYALVDKILNYYDNEGVAKLLECTDSKETEFLELKTSYLLSEQDAKDGKRQENLTWDIALALIAIANTAGGALIIGVKKDSRTLCPVEVKEDKEAFLRMNICQVLLPDQRVWTVCEKNGKDKNGKDIYVKERWMADGLPQFEARLYPYFDGEESGDVVLILVKPQPRGRYITLENINQGTKLLVQREKGIGKVFSCYDSANFRTLDNERDIECGWYLTLLRKLVPDLNASPIGRSIGVYRFKPADGYNGKDIVDPLVRQTEGHRLCCDFKPGDQIDKYKVEERIGSGGMGVVYRVSHVTLGREYALKAFKMEPEDASMAKERFRAEAQVLMHLNHPGLPKVHDLDFAESAECYYLVQDLIVGKDGKPHELGGYVVNPNADDTSGLVRISSETALKWLRQVCEIADYLHRKGIAHRDITLKNLLVTDDGDVKLTDFGVAKVMDPELRREIDCQVTMTFTQTPNGSAGFLGTLQYLPPEVKEKRKADIKPEATDVWAIGVSFFKILTGEWFGSQQFTDYGWNDGIWGKLLRGMLKVDSTLRLSCAEVLSLLDDEGNDGAEILSWHRGPVGFERW